MRIFDSKLLDDLTAAARACTRGRKNRNVHDSYDDPCQRLFNAVEPRSYVRPHRHLTPPKPETFIAMRGRLAILVFDDDGALQRVAVLGDGGVAGVDVPPGAWHAVLSLEEGSIFFESKPGPYEPISDKDWAPWAPPEDSPEASEYLAKLKAAADHLLADPSSQSHHPRT